MYWIPFYSHTHMVPTVRCDVKIFPNISTCMVLSIIWVFILYIYMWWGNDLWVIKFLVIRIHSPKLLKVLENWKNSTVRRVSVLHVAVWVQSLYHIWFPEISRTDPWVQSWGKCWQLLNLATQSPKISLRCHVGHTLQWLSLMLCYSAFSLELLSVWSYKYWEK